jgi:hypothetical protein
MFQPSLDVGARLAHILDLLAEDSWRNVYAGELEVRPPGAPTIPRKSWRAHHWLSSRGRIGRPFSTSEGVVRLGLDLLTLNTS